MTRDTYSKGTVIFLVFIWTFLVFLSAADRESPYPLIQSLTMRLTTVMMILRVYAVWNRSRKILCVLLFIYMAQTVISIIIAGIYINPNTYMSGMSWDNAMVLVLS